MRFNCERYEKVDQNSSETKRNKKVKIITAFIFNFFINFDLVEITFLIIAFQLYRRNLITGLFYKCFKRNAILHKIVLYNKGILNMQLFSKHLEAIITHNFTFMIMS